MSQAGLVARLAWRELWITFRMLLLLVAFVGIGALVVLVPAAPATMLERAAIGLGVATSVLAAVTAWTVADERIRGRTGWLMARSVSRGTYLLGWFGALLSVSLAGLAAAGLLIGMSVSTGPLAPEPLELASAVAAVAAGVAAAVALGILVGALGRPLPAATIAALLCLLAAAAALGLPEAGAFLPQVVLAEVAGPGSVVEVAMRSAGLALLLCAILLTLARLTFERVEL